MAIPAIYHKYITDTEKEKNGVTKDFGDFVITGARAGGSNEEYGRLLAELFQPYEQVMSLGEMDDAKAGVIWQTVLIRAVIKLWSFKENGTLVQGLGRDEMGLVVPATEDNILELFQESHELFVEIRSFFERRENFARYNLKAAAKN